MFIYKITNTANSKIYIGYDTGKVSDESRWQYHKKHYKYERNKVLYFAMKKYGIENFVHEVVEEVYTIETLIDKEIFYIDFFQSHQPTIGYNRTLGGDGGDTFSIRSAESQELTRNKMRESAIKWWATVDTDSRKDLLKQLNKEKWKNTTPEQRKEMVKPAFTPEVNARRAESLKEYYKAVPGAKEHKINKILEWQKLNKEEHKQIAKKNGAKGAAKVSKRLKVELETGEVLYYSSKSDFQRKTGQWANTIIRKTQEGIFYNGYKIWEEK